MRRAASVLAALLLSLVLSGCALFDSGPPADPADTNAFRQMAPGKLAALQQSAGLFQPTWDGVRQGRISAVESADNVRALHERLTAELPPLQAPLRLSGAEREMHQALRGAYEHRLAAYAALLEWAKDGSAARFQEAQRELNQADQMQTAAAKGWGKLAGKGGY